VSVPDEGAAHFAGDRDHDQFLELLRQAGLGADVGPESFEPLRHFGHVQQERVRADVGSVRPAHHERVIRGLFFLGDLISGDERDAGHGTSLGRRDRAIMEWPRGGFKVKCARGR
jgi:hypothetical protein